MDKKFLGVLLLFVIVLSSEINMVKVEGYCAKPSMFYHGFCGSDSSCTNACVREQGWKYGVCVNHGFLNSACECRKDDPC